MEKTRSTKLAALLMLLVISLPTSCKGGSSPRVEPIVAFYVPFQTLALLWTAEEQGLFDRNGLHATLREYTTGAASVNGVLNGEADIAVWPSKFALVGQALNGERIRILGCVDQVEHVAVVARKDRGIEQPSDLKGRIVKHAFAATVKYDIIVTSQDSPASALHGIIR